MSRLLLYGRDQCHLCHEAEALLAAGGLSATPVDVSRDPALEESYGLRIPVLHNVATGRELDWPFDTPSARALAGEPGLDT